MAERRRRAIPRRARGPAGGRLRGPGLRRPGDRAVLRVPRLRHPWTEGVDVHAARQRHLHDQVRRMDHRLVKEAQRVRPARAVPLPSGGQLEVDVQMAGRTRGDRFVGLVVGVAELRARVELRGLAVHRSAGERASRSAVDRG